MLVYIPVTSTIFYVLPTVDCCMCLCLLQSARDYAGKCMSVKPYGAVGRVKKPDK